jgi:hypothetical protein
MTLRSRTAVAALLFLATLGSPLTASAAPQWAEADQHFRHGVELFKENNFSAALVEFKRAYEIDPKYQVLYNVGESYYQLQDYANALQTFRTYLVDGGDKISPKRRKDVEAEIETLKGRVATLRVRTNEQGASVTVDDVPVGTTPLEPLTVSAGRRRVTASLPGRVPVTQMIDLAGGDEKILQLEISSLPAPIEGPKPPPTQPPPPPSIVPTVVAWSATGALATGAVITGVLALAASSDLEAELVRFPGDAQALASAKSSAFGLGLATDILMGTSIAAAGLATYFTIDWAVDSDAAASTAPQPSARVTVLPGGVSVDGTF